MNILLSVIKKLIQINVITAMLSVLVFVVIREQQATTTDNQQKLDEPQSYHSTVKEQLSDEQQLQNSYQKIQEYEQRLKQMEGLLKNNNAQSTIFSWDRLTAKTASTSVPKSSNNTSLSSGSKITPSTQANLPLLQTTQKIEYHQWSNSINPSFDRQPQGSKIGQNLAIFRDDRPTEVNKNSRTDTVSNSSVSQLTASIWQSQPTPSGSQWFIPTDKLLFKYWNAVLFQPLLATNEKNKPTLSIYENLSAKPDVVIAEIRQTSLEIARTETKIPIHPAIATNRGDPRIAKDTSIGHANDIAYGLIVANEKGHINYGTNTYRRVQTAIRLLRRGESISNAARRAEIEAEVLNQLIKWGENRPGSIAAARAREEKSNLR